MDYTNCEPQFRLDREMFGEFVYEGIDLALYNQPYLHGTHEQPFYEAHAYDLDENEYLLRFEIINPEAEDESDRCNWNNYMVRKY